MREDHVIDHVIDLLRRYRRACGANNLSNTTQAKILGVSLTRYSELRGQDRPLVELGTYLRMMEFLTKVYSAEQTGVLPANKRSGECQQRVVDYFCRH